MMNEPAVDRIRRVLAQHYSDGACDSHCGSICDCFGQEPVYASRAAQAVLAALREPLAAVFCDLDVGGWEPGRTASAQQLVQGKALADEVLQMLGMKEQVNG
jgi:hypothetical protein